jgi:hypothetical protein
MIGAPERAGYLQCMLENWIRAFQVPQAFWTAIEKFLDRFRTLFCSVFVTVCFIERSILLYHRPVHTNALPCYQQEYLVSDVANLGEALALAVLVIK